MSELTNQKRGKPCLPTYAENSQLSMRQLFAEDPKRFDRFSLRLDDLLLDYSKNLVTEETMRLLFALARQAKWKAGATGCLPARRSIAPSAVRCCTRPCVLR
jgi:glucose-6-phosphate isomerase